MTAIFAYFDISKIFENAKREDWWGNSAIIDFILQRGERVVREKGFEVLNISGIEWQFINSLCIE